jgi:hypothetical protein
MTAEMILHSTPDGRSGEENLLPRRGIIAVGINAGQRESVTNPAFARGLRWPGADGFGTQCARAGAGCRCAMQRSRVFVAVVVATGTPGRCDPAMGLGPVRGSVDGRDGSRQSGLAANTRPLEWVGDRAGSRLRHGPG